MSSLKKIQLINTEETCYYTTLANGLRLYLLPKPEFKETSGVISVNFGSVDTTLTDDAGNLTRSSYGLAHFLEHKLFELQNGKDANLEFTKLGAESNAFTGFEQTSYLFSTRNHVIANLQLLLELLSGLHVTEESVVREKAIIAQEIDMYADDSDYMLYSGSLQNLYPNTALGTDIAGTRDSLSQMTVEELLLNYRTYYYMANMSLFLVGQFDVKEVYNFVKEYHFPFSTKSQDIVTERQFLDHPPVIGKRVLHMPDVTKPKFSLGIRGLPSLKFSLLEQKIGLQLFFALLFGWTSKQYQEWYESGRIDDSFDIEIEVSHRFRFVLFLLDTDQPIAMSNLLKKALQYKGKSLDMTDSHLELVKREMYGDFIRSLDDIGHLVTQFSSYLTAEQTYFDIPTCLQELTLADVLTIGDDFLNQAEMTEFTIFPK